MFLSPVTEGAGHLLNASQILTEPDSKQTACIASPAQVKNLSAARVTELQKNIRMPEALLL
jgi:hypothetical protein